MPPASLSTFAVMMPGPTTASSAARRTRPDFSDVLRAAARTRSGLPPQQVDDVVCGDDAGQTPVFVHDRKREQVVLVEELDNLVFGRVEMTADERLGAEGRERRGLVGD